MKVKWIKIMNKEDRITYEGFIIAFSKFPKLVYTLYDKAEDEIERLNNIINELERWLKEDLKNNYRDAGYRHNLIIEVLDKLKELKDSD